MASLEVQRAEAKMTLAPHVASGRALVLAAAMIGDEEDFGVWSWRCKDWSTGLNGALRYIYGNDAARTFERATRAPRHGSGWETAVRDEIDRLQGTIEMLGELSDELRDPGPVRSAVMEPPNGGQ